MGLLVALLGRLLLAAGLLLKGEALLELLDLEGSGAVAGGRAVVVLGATISSFLCQGRFTDNYAVVFVVIFIFRAVG